MPKFYVSSGNLSVTLVAKNNYQAAIIAFSKLLHNASSLGHITMVSEHGFNSLNDDDSFFLTSDLLQKTNQSHKFSNSEWL